MRCSVGCAGTDGSTPQSAQAAFTSLGTHQRLSPCRWSGWCTASNGSTTTASRTPCCKTSLHPVVLSPAVASTQASTKCGWTASYTPSSSQISSSAGDGSARTASANSKYTCFHCCRQACACQGRAPKEAHRNDQPHRKLSGQ